MPHRDGVGPELFWMIDDRPRCLLVSPVEVSQGSLDTPESRTVRNGDLSGVSEMEEQIQMIRGGLRTTGVEEGRFRMSGKFQIDMVEAEGVLWKGLGRSETGCSRENEGSTTGLKSSKNVCEYKVGP